MAHQQTFLKSIPAVIALAFLFVLFRLMPLDAASALGSFIGRCIGPKLKWHRVATRNLQAVYPQKSEAELDQILAAMWDNLGRTLAEYPWLNTAQFAARVQIPDIPLLPNAIYAAAHLGNWEVAPLAAHLRGVSMTLIYRHIKNPLVDRLIYRIRAAHCAGLYPKGKRGAAEVLRALKAGKPLGMLVDQKMNEGVELPFMGLPAMSAPATAELALRFNVPIVMARVLRERGARFKVELTEITYTPENSASEIMMKIHHQLEEWTHETPAQWLWIHRRWGRLSN